MKQKPGFDNTLAQDKKPVAKKRSAPGVRSDSDLENTLIKNTAPVKKAETSNVAEPALINAMTKRAAPAKKIALQHRPEATGSDSKAASLLKTTPTTIEAATELVAATTSESVPAGKIALVKEPVVKRATNKKTAQSNDRIDSRVRFARKYAGITQKELADRVMLTQTAIQKIEAGKTLNSTRVVQIAIECGINPIWLQKGTGPIYFPTQSEKHQEQYSELERPNIQHKLAPVLEQNQLIGSFDLDDLVSNPSHTQIPVSVMTSMLTFGFQVVGDSMVPQFCHGDYVVVNPLPLPNDTPPNNSFVLARLTMEKTSKQFIALRQYCLDEKGKVTLKPINQDYSPTPFTDKDKIIGVVVSKFKSYNPVGIF